MDKLCQSKEKNWFFIQHARNTELFFQNVLESWRILPFSWEKLFSDIGQNEDFFPRTEQKYHCRTSSTKQYTVAALNIQVEKQRLCSKPFHQAKQKYLSTAWVVSVCLSISLMISQHSRAWTVWPMTWQYWNPWFHLVIVTSGIVHIRIDTLSIKNLWVDQEIPYSRCLRLSALGNLYSRGCFTLEGGLTSTSSCILNSYFMPCLCWALYVTFRCTKLLLGFIESIKSMFHGCIIFTR